MWFDERNEMQSEGLFLLLLQADLIFFVCYCFVWLVLANGVVVHASGHGVEINLLELGFLIRTFSRGLVTVVASIFKNGFSV